jgi:type I restriction-modification system DNA methylase subunit
MPKNKWIQILDELTHFNQPKALEYRIHEQILVGGEAYRNDPENHEEGTTLLSKILMAHIDYLQVKKEPGDMFGDYMTQAETSLIQGQVFTPMHICDAMTAMTITPEAMQKPQRILDPAAGTGRFMLATAKHYMKTIGSCNFIFYNVDIEFRAYVFCTMNAILNNIPAVTVHGDSLLMKYYDGYATIPSFTGAALWKKLPPEKIRRLFVSEPQVQLQPAPPPREVQVKL